MKPLYMLYKAFRSSLFTVLLCDVTGKVARLGMENHYISFIDPVMWVGVYFHGTVAQGTNSVS